ncbi:Biotin synthase [uncultured archaeon]|nr:Biotin synthase [uncultured archaeon]
MIEKHLGKLSKGCQLCFTGEKLVLFVTGICPKRCIYCPLSKEKKNKDVIYANEVNVKSIKDLLEEVEKSNSKGAGITGGDPLSKLSRTISYIRALKNKFGKKFHIHLYTSLDLVSPKSVKQLKDSGLDELRIHLDIENKKEWKKLSLLKNKFPEVGIEIPVLPGKEKEVIQAIDFCKKYVNFFNLNELEYATLYEEEYKKHKWKVNEKYEVTNSEKTALNILNHFKNKKVRIHYCSAEFKDKIQFCERIKVRAKKVAETFDKITEEGTLLRGAIYLKETKPTFESELKKLDRNRLRKELDLFFNQLRREFPKTRLRKDYQKLRILTDLDSIKKLSKKVPNCAIVEEYPTEDHLEVYMEFLS